MQLPLACLTALLTAGTLAHSVAAQIAVDQQTVTLNPAGERVANLVVRNTGLIKAELLVRLGDWDVDAQGESHWRKAGAVAGSCGARVSLSPSSLSIPPGEQQVVRVSLSHNAHFSAECWSAVVVRSANSALPRTKRDSLLTQQTTIPLYVTPDGLSVDGELTDMFVKRDSLEVVFKNTGKLRTHIVGEIQVQTQSDSVVTTIPLDSAVVLVGAMRRYRVAMPKLPHGQYLLVALVDFGGTQLTAVQAALEMR